MRGERKSRRYGQGYALRFRLTRRQSLNAPSGSGMWASACRPLSGAALTAWPPPIGRVLPPARARRRLRPPPLTSISVRPPFPSRRPFLPPSHHAHPPGPAIARPSPLGVRYRVRLRAVGH